MSKHDLRVVKTKERIHYALTECLKEKPLSRIKITELCKTANINRGTFYFHYQEVGDVFMEFFEEIMEDLKDSYEEPYRHNVFLDVKNLDPDTVRIFHHIKKYEDFYSVIFSEKVSISYYYMFFDAVKEVLEKDPHSEKIDGPRDFFFSYTSNAIIGLIIEWYRRGFRDSAEDMSRNLVFILKKGER
ncbi:TetR/AcrR family transcriptional regulator [Jeotgalibacillus terrae]|uniref:TetR/AcrR family transcriptional regulator n=1 Tax=Jeotgalibacillus terrae TaxID=587735 RepID=A0ABW5ZHR2_9BACL|nr:TetR-like C-terminal domain-containing protein [Jeotgalibacillus terrae]MBM7580386.1 AcrR family transcriptional regulator [Jeotgalibacillus terrae]